MTGNDGELDVNRESLDVASNSLSLLHNEMIRI